MLKNHTTIREKWDIMKKTKKILFLALTIIFSATLATAGIMTYFVKMDATITVKPLIMYSEDQITWVPAEELEYTYIGETNPGNDYYKQFYLKMNIEDYEESIYFHVTCLETGLTSVVYNNNGNEVTNYLLTDTPTMFCWSTCADRYLMSGEYEASLVIDMIP